MNAKPKWTPGPWEIGYLDNNGQRIVRQEHIEICTCWHHSVGSIEKEMEANAHLIAAAPDMYEALEKSAEGWANAIELGLLPPQHIASAEILRDKARAALSKARGQS